jgi:cold shock CspA family protein
MMRLPDIAAEHVIATVEFFDHFRGFGFVEVPSLKDKAFLHARTLEQYGIRDLRDGDEILCDVVRSSKGLAVARVKTVRPLQTKTAHAIVVKLLSERAYGFVQIQETGTDAFFHYNVLTPERRQSLTLGQQLTVEVKTDKEGRSQVRRVISYS